jgi:hypothetical protein
VCLVPAFQVLNGSKISKDISNVIK